MSGTAKNVGTLHDKITGSEGRNEIERLTKNPALEKFNLEAQGDYTKARGESQLGLEQYIRDLLAGTATATTRSGQEQSVVDRFYNGDVERQLAANRAQDALLADRALNQAFANFNRTSSADQVSGSPGASSWNLRSKLGVGSGLALDSDLRQAAQRRSDEDYLRQMGLGLAGRRTAMADTLAGRAMLPGQARQALLGWENATIASLLGNDAANNMYGVKYIPSAGEQITEVGTNISNDLQDAVAMYGSLYGGQGPQPHNTTPVGTTNFGTWAPSGGFSAPSAGQTYGWGMSPSAAPAGGGSIPPLGNMYSSIPYGYAPSSFGAAPVNTSVWGSPAFANAFGF